jgi:hypothetical protein
MPKHWYKELTGAAARFSRAGVKKGEMCHVTVTVRSLVGIQFARMHVECIEKSVCFLF